MIKTILDTTGKIITDSLTDSQTGKFSHAKVIAMLVAIAATVFMWKLILLGGMSLDYFIAYLAYGTGHQTLNKYLDNRPGGRNVGDSIGKVSANIYGNSSSTTPAAPTNTPTSFTAQPAPMFSVGASIQPAPTIVPANIPPGNLTNSP
jgi:hypothetical protein